MDAGAFLVSGPKALRRQGSPFSSFKQVDTAHLHLNPPPLEPFPTLIAWASRKHIRILRRSNPVPFTSLLPNNIIPAKEDASGATDEVNPGSTTNRATYLTGVSTPVKTEI